MVCGISLQLVASVMAKLFKSRLYTLSCPNAAAAATDATEISLIRSEWNKPKILSVEIALVLFMCDSGY